MSDVWALKLPHSTFQGHIPMHSLLIFQGMLQGWPIKPVTKLDYVNQQLLNLVSQLAEAMYKVAACSKSRLCYLASTQHMVFFSKKKWHFI